MKEASKKALKKTTAKQGREKEKAEMLRGGCGEHHEQPWAPDGQQTTSSIEQETRKVSTKKSTH